MKNEESIQKKYAPPYVAVRRLEEAFKLLTSRSFSKMGVEDLTTRGFSKVDATQTVAGLKFLGVITEDGTLSGGKILQLVGEERKKGMLDLVKSAYKDLFSTAPQANTLSREELHNEFVAIYHVSGRLARTAVPAFLWLCSEVGLEVSEQIESRERKTPVKQKAKIVKIDSVDNILPGSHRAVSFGDEHEYIIPFGILKLVIPNTDKARTALLKGDFQTVADQLTKLSEELIEDTPTSGDGGLAER